MKIRTFFTLDSNVYRAALHTEDWSQRDVQLMERLGEPEINLGGAFYDGAAMFELPDTFVRIKSESPMVQGFDSRDFADADDRANVWAAEIRTRISSAIVALRALDTTFEREEVATV